MTSMMPDTFSVQSRAGLFSLRGRIGRVRYLAYCMSSIVIAMLFMALAGLGLLLAGPGGRTLYIVVSVLLFYGLLPIFFTVMTIKRAHDFNMGGWLALLLLVPVINLMFCFIPGTKDENRYGSASPDESLGMKLIAIISPLLLIAAFLATGGPIQIQRSDSSSISPPATTLKPYTP